MRTIHAYVSNTKVMVGQMFKLFYIVCIHFEFAFASLNKYSLAILLPTSKLKVQLSLGYDTSTQT